MAKHARSLCAAAFGFMSMGVWAQTEVLPPAAPPSPPGAVPFPTARPQPATPAAPASAQSGASPSAATAPAPVPAAVPVPADAPAVEAETPPAALVPHDHNAMMPDDGEAMPMATMRHAMRAGDWMFEYRYAREVMNGLLRGSKKVSTQDLFNDPAYQNAGKSDTMASPAMTMDMNMLMVMYTMSDRWTWTAMINPYMSNSMDMEMAGAMPSADAHDHSNMPMMSSKGLGDTELGFIYRLTSAEPDDTWQISAGLSLPTGSVDVKGSDGLRLPYSMQLGSGTVDVKLALSYEHQWGQWAFGGKAADTARMGHNKHGWNAGDRQEVSTWGNYRFSFGTTVQTKLAFLYQEQINGSDSGMGDTTTYAGIRPDSYGGVRLDLIGTVSQELGPVTISGDLGMPIHQNANGVQTKTTWLFGFSIAYML